MNVIEHRQLALGLHDSGTPQSDVLANPVLFRWVAQLMPVLLVESEYSTDVLAAIHDFIFVQKKARTSDFLEQELTEELYLTLIGFKQLLAENKFSWQKTMLKLEESKRLKTLDMLERTR